MCGAFWKISVAYLEKKSWNSYNKRTQNNCVKGGKMLMNKTREKFVRQKLVGTYVWTGNLHSGKTSTAIARMIYLLEHACHLGEQVLYVCQNEAEKRHVSSAFHQAYPFSNVSLFEEENQGHAVIKTMDELIEEAADKADVHLNLAICEEMPKALILEMLPKVRKQYPKVKWLKASEIDFIQQELKWMNGCGYMDFEAYQNAQRKGAAIKLPKKGSGRKAMWCLKEETNKQLKAQGYMTKDQVQVDTWTYLKEDGLRTQYRHIIVDDAHKLTKVQLECIRLLKTPDEGEVLFLMDKTQKDNPLAWLGMGNSFKTIGYDMTGRIKKLSDKRKVGGKAKKIKPSNETPLECLIKEMEEKTCQTELTVQEEVKKQGKTLPWYVETYQYLNKITGVETVFQVDSSAGETYIDEIKQDEVEELPIYSDIAAGMPIELVDEVSGKFMLPSELLHHKRNRYILHVQGDSMIGVGIDDGDYVVIEAGNVNDHEIGAVYYNGTTTLKRIVQEKERILLVSENPKYKPIVIEEGDFRAMGKLIGVIKPM